MGVGPGLCEMWTTENPITVPWWHSSKEHHLLKATTTDEDRRQANEQDEDNQPDDHEKGRVGSTRRSRAGPPSLLSPVSSAAGSPALPHDAPREVAAA